MSYDKENIENYILYTALDYFKNNYNDASCKEIFKNFHFKKQDFCSVLNLLIEKGYFIKGPSTRLKYRTSVFGNNEEDFLEDTRLMGINKEKFLPETKIKNINNYNIQNSGNIAIGNNNTQNLINKTINEEKLKEIFEELINELKEIKDPQERENKVSEVFAKHGYSIAQIILASIPYFNSFF